MKQCPECDPAGLCSFACHQEMSLEDQQRAVALRAILIDSVADMRDQRLTPGTMTDLIKRRFAIRILMQDQLLERESGD